MADLVAWAPIKSGKNKGSEKEPDMETINVKPGDSVSQDALGVDDEGWKQLLESGAVRKMTYPDMPETFQGSPVDYLREKARKAAEGVLTDVETSEENIAMIAEANAASTGVSLLPNVEPATGPSEDATPASTTTVFTTRDSDGALLASDDGGQTWRKPTDEERAAQ